MPGMCSRSVAIASESHLQRRASVLVFQVGGVSSAGGLRHAAMGTCRYAYYRWTACVARLAAYLSFFSLASRWRQREGDKRPPGVRPTQSRATDPP